MELSVGGALLPDRGGILRIHAISWARARHGFPHASRGPGQRRTQSAAWAVFRVSRRGIDSERQDLFNNAIDRRVGMSRQFCSESLRNIDRETRHEFLIFSQWTVWAFRPRISNPTKWKIHVRM